MPEHCAVKGSIGALTSGAQPIGFQVNLPTDWNAKLIQMGGGGLNGSLTSGLDYIGTSTNAGSYNTPLNRRYMTAGTDSGHLISASPRLTSTDPAVRAGAGGDFALNDEMLRNFAHESYKKVKDVAIVLAKRYYDAKPTRTYFIGGSEGGREALIVAQRYGADYDGVFARAPVLNWTGAIASFIRTAQQQLANNGAAFMGTEDIRLLYRTVLQACDGKDGVVDGVVSDYLGCRSLAEPAIRAKLCTGAYTAGSCFTQPQLTSIESLYSPSSLPFSVANGVTQIPAMTYGGEAGPSAIAQWRTGATAGLQFGGAGMSVALNYGGNAVKYFYAQDQNADILSFNPINFQARIQAVSSLIDATSPDLSTFNNRGGKMLIVSCGGDAAVPANTHFQYHDAVVAKMGQASSENLLRLYVSPSANHGCGDTINTTGISATGLTVDGAQTSAGTANGLQVNVDWIAILEAWVERGEAPGSSVLATSNAPTAPFAVRSSKPLCRYPLYAKFTGTNAADAASYTCVASGS
jgi:feruloyl esterase